MCYTRVYIANRAKNVNKHQPNPSSCQYLGPLCEFAIYTSINKLFIYTPLHKNKNKIGPPTDKGPRPSHLWLMARAGPDNNLNEIV